MDHPAPFTALRAFEAAARHLSFAAAADELGVTPAALSFQIRSLEDQLGAPVFHRHNRAVSLTEIGAALHPGITDGLGTLTRACSTHPAHSGLHARRNRRCHPLWSERYTRPIQ